MSAVAASTPKQAKFPWHNHASTLIRLCATNPKLTVEELHAAFKRDVVSAGYGGDMVDLKAFRYRLTEIRSLAMELKQLREQVPSDEALAHDPAQAATRQRLAIIYETTHVEDDAEGQQNLLVFGGLSVERAAQSVQKREKRNSAEARLVKLELSPVAAASAAVARPSNSQAAADQRLDLIEEDFAELKSKLATLSELTSKLAGKVDGMMQLAPPPPPAETPLQPPRKRKKNASEESESID